MDFPQISQLHLWFTSLKEAHYQEGDKTLLNAEEMQRANRFKFELHRRRFITARATLRSILSQYLNISHQKIQIAYTEEGKPYLEDQDLKFNLSHSHDIAIYAFTYQMAIGVDIEKIRDTYNDEVAQRFFSSAEYESFSALAPREKVIDFYRIWAGKEALVKALGKGFGFSLSSFTIPSKPKVKEVVFDNKPCSENWYLENLTIFPGYQAAFATNQDVKEICVFEWTAEGVKPWPGKLPSPP